MKERKYADYVVDMNWDGELIQKHHLDWINTKYKPDTPFLWGPVPYILMLICCSIDIAFFRGLFIRISYESPLMIVFEVIGLAFAADIVAAFAGVLAKRLAQELSTNRMDKLNLGLLLAVPIFALFINGVLRYVTISLNTMDGTVTAEAVALCVIAIVTPIFTSIGNFAISFFSYDPLMIKMKSEELALADSKDYRRRLLAIKDECDDFSEAAIIARDRCHLQNAKKELVNDALVRYAAVRRKLMEHLGDPTATNVLSKVRCDELFDRLMRELKELEAVSDNIPSVDIPDDHDQDWDGREVYLETID